MADIYIDAEWTHDDDITLLGMYCHGVGFEQLWGHRLTEAAVDRYIDRCRTTRGDRTPIIFCHGPDVGRLRRQTGSCWKCWLPCVNTVHIATKLTGHRTSGLGHLSRQYGHTWNEYLDGSSVHKLWLNGGRSGRLRVREYNRSDVMNLWSVTRAMRNRYRLSRDQLLKEAMPCRSDICDGKPHRGWP